MSTSPRRSTARRARAGSHAKLRPPCFSRNQPLPLHAWRMARCGSHGARADQAGQAGEAATRRGAAWRRAWRRGARPAQRGAARQVGRGVRRGVQSTPSSPTPPRDPRTPHSATAGRRGGRAGPEPLRAGECPAPSKRGAGEARPGEAGRGTRPGAPERSSPRGGAVLQGWRSAGGALGPHAAVGARELVCHTDAARKAVNAPLPA